MMKFPSIRKRIIAGCFGVLFFHSGNVFSQVDDGFMQVPTFTKCVDITLPYYNQRLAFSNGNIPFSENGKWGVKGLVGNMVVSPIYDSLLAFAYSSNDFIALKNGEYFLFNDQHLPVFQQGMKRIEYIRDSIVVLDQTGERSTYSINYDVYTTFGYPYVSSPNNKVNHLVIRPEIRVVQNPKTQSFGFYEDYIIAMSLEPIEGTKNSTCKLFYGIDMIATTLEVETDGTKYLGHNYLFTGKNNLQTSWIINVLNGDTVLTCNNVKATYFEKDSLDYFLLNSLDAIVPTSFVLNLMGDTIFSSSGKYGFAAGCLTEYLYKDSLEHVNLYSFPEHIKLENDICVSSSYEDYGLFLRSDSLSYDVYGYGKCLYTLYDKHAIGFSGLNYHGHDKVVNVYYVSDNKTIGVVILSSNGKVLFQDNNNHTDLTYNEQVNAYTGYFQIMTKNGLKSFLGVYDEQNDCIHYSIYDYEDVELIAPNVLIYIKKDEYHNEYAKSLINLDGNYYSETKYKGVRYFSVDQHSFILTWDGKQLVGYDENMNVMCTDCYLNEMRGEPGYEPDRKFLTVWRAENCLSEVLDGNLNKVLPGFYRLAEYNCRGDYFIVINENRELEYIRYTDTEYYKMQLK